MSTHTLIYILLFFAFIFLFYVIVMHHSIYQPKYKLWKCVCIHIHQICSTVVIFYVFFYGFGWDPAIALGTKYVYHNQPFPPDLATASSISPVRRRTIASTFFFAARNPSPSAPLRSIHWRWSMWHLIDMTPDILTYSTYCILFEYIYICIWDNIKIIMFAIILNIFP